MLSESDTDASVKTEKYKKSILINTPKHAPHKRLLSYRNFANYAAHIKQLSLGT